MDCVVLDNGSCAVRAGYCGEDQPQCVVPSKVGTVAEKFGLEFASGGTKSFRRARSAATGDAQSGESKLVGKKALRAAGASVELTRAIDRGRIVDWEAMQRVWDHVFEHELRVERDASPVLLTECPLVSLQDREKMAELMFELYDVPGALMASEAVLSLFSTGRTRGIVVGVGSGVSTVVPVFESFALRHATKRVPFAGEDLTKLLQTKLDVKLPESTVQDIKETMCAVSEHKLDRAAEGSHAPSSNLKGQNKVSFRSQTGAVDPRSESSVSKGNLHHGLASTVATYELPDGQMVDVSRDCRCIVPEAMFNPSVCQNSSMESGISYLTFQSILACDKTLQSDLFSSVVLAGGSTMFPGFAARLRRDLVGHSQQSEAKVQVLQDSQRKFAAWIGGSMLASLGTFRQVMTSRAEYEEHGARIVHEKAL